MDQDGFIDILSVYKKMFEQLSANYDSGKETPEQVCDALQKLLSRVKTLGLAGEQLANQISDKSMSIPRKKETPAEILQRLISERTAQDNTSTETLVIRERKPSDFTPDSLE